MPLYSMNRMMNWLFVMGIRRSLEMPCAVNGNVLNEKSVVRSKNENGPRQPANVKAVPNAVELMVSM